MDRLAKLRQKRAAAVARMQAIRDRAQAESRDALTADETSEFDAALAESRQLQGEIEREEALQGEERAIGQSQRPPTRPNPEENPDDPNDDTDQRSAVLTSGAWGTEEYRRFGEFLLDVVRADAPENRGRALPPSLERRAASGMGESVPSDGGFLVQHDFSAELLRRAYASGVLASRVRRIQLGANSKGLRINAIDETSRADGSRWGGVTSYWVNEGDLKTASRPKLRQMELNLKKLIGLCYATDELVEDAAALGQIIMDAFADEFAFRIDDAILRGTGAAQPLGILNSPALVSVAAESGQAAGTLQAENLVKMYSRMWASSRRNAVWVYNQDVEPSLFGLALSIGTGGVPVFMPPGGLTANPFSTLYGLPMIPVEQAATLGTVGDVLLIDPSQYILVDKGAMKSDSSIHVRFIYDETTFRFVYRADGMPTWHSALTPANGSNTLSPYVALATR